MPDAYGYENKYEFCLNQDLYMTVCIKYMWLVRRLFVLLLVLGRVGSEIYSKQALSHKQYAPRDRPEI
jgi:hypothetical protein